MSRRTASGILGLAVVGLCASIAAAVVHYRLLADPLYRSVCDFNATWSCTQVYESAYGAFWGVPVAVGGVVWFTAVTLLAVAGWRGAGTTGPAGALAGRVAAYVFGLSIIGPYGTLHAYKPEDQGPLNEATGNPFAAMVTGMALFAQAPPIYGGTDQVQRNIIGERVLGLPKEASNDKTAAFKDLPKNA